MFVSGPQNGRILAGLRLELGVRLEKTCESLRCQFARRCVHATLKNTSCGNSSSEADWLYGPWVGRVRETGRQAGRQAHKKGPARGIKEGRRHPGDARSPLMGFSQTGEAKVAGPYLLSGEATSPGHWGSSVSPISQANQALR